MPERSDKCPRGAILYALQDIQEHYNIDNVVFVADSGMFNKSNLEEFDRVYKPFLFKYKEYKWSDKAKRYNLIDQQQQYKAFNKNYNITYIVGARIKNMNKSLKEQILDMSNYKEIDDNTKVATFEYQGKKLLVTHSQKRAKKR